MVAPINPTQLTPPRVNLIDERSGAISREWYRFFLSLLTATQTTQAETELSPDTSALLASYDAMLADLAQTTETSTAAAISALAVAQSDIQSLALAPPGNSGSVTSVDASGGSTGLTFSGGPITFSGTLTLGGTLGTANGGTGVTTSTGTVSVVLSNSPTLVTPTLGAASATSIANGLGAVGTPAYTFTGDLNTGMWSPAADTVAVSTSGSERLRIDSAGDVGIGTTNPLFPLEVNGEVRATKFTSDAGSQSLADNTDLTVLTLTGVTVRLFLVSVNTTASAGSDMTVALVAVGTDGSGGAESTVTQLVNGATTDVTVANVAGTSTVSVKQTTGVTLTVSYSITRLM